MKKLSILSMFIALLACTTCQRQQREERNNSETQREMQERAAAEHSAEAQQKVTQGEGNPNARENASEMLPEPGSSASSGTSPEKRNTFKSQAQKFQPRRIVPMTSPITETPSSTPTSSEPEPRN